MALEVPDDRVHVHLRMLVGDGARRVPQRHLAHVERNEPSELPGLRECIEQESGLLRRAGTELDERVRAAGGCDLVGAGVEDRALGAGRVVLLESGDLVEQLRPPIVVEPLRRQVLG